MKEDERRRILTGMEGMEGINTKRSRLMKKVFPKCFGVIYYLLNFNLLSHWEN